MQRQYRLGCNRRFQYVYRRGKRVSSPALTLVYTGGRQKKFGFSVSKKVGCAVVRNRVRRRLRECVRPLLPVLGSGQFVFIARNTAAATPFDRLRTEVYGLLHRCGALKEEPRAKEP